LSWTGGDNPAMPVVNPDSDTSADQRPSPGSCPTPTLQDSALAKSMPSGSPYFQNSASARTEVRPSALKTEPPMATSALPVPGPGSGLC
jgi:hypothetical protein